MWESGQKLRVQIRKRICLSYSAGKTNTKCHYHECFWKECNWPVMAICKIWQLYHRIVVSTRWLLYPSCHCCELNSFPDPKGVPKTSKNIQKHGPHCPRLFLLHRLFGFMVSPFLLGSQLTERGSRIISSVDIGVLGSTSLGLGSLEGTCIGKYMP